MGTKTLLTLAEFEQLPEQEGIRYELDEAAGQILEQPDLLPGFSAPVRTLFEE